MDNLNAFLLWNTSIKQVHLVGRKEAVQRREGIPSARGMLGDQRDAVPAVKYQFDAAKRLLKYDIQPVSSSLLVHFPMLQVSIP